MGKQWVGFQPATTPVAGRSLVERSSFDAAIPDARLVALVTTRAGLEDWLATITAFSDRRGGSVEFADAKGAFGGTFTLVDAPRQVVLVTERHGEIDIRIDVRQRPSRVSVVISRFVPDTEDEGVAISAMRDVVERLQQGCTRGR